jgi:hypothetical protein
MNWARFVRSIAFPAVLAMVTVSPVRANADGRDPDAVRIAAAGHSLKWNWTPPGRADRYGHAETLVHAPLSAVRQHVLDFGRYREFVPNRFRTSRVVGHQPDGSVDVYLQVAVLHGMVTLWDVARFAPPRSSGTGSEIVEGHMVPGKGNVDDMVAVWTIRAIGDEWTLLKFDLLLKPGMPAPQSAVDEELRDSALYAVDAVHDRAQGSSGIAPWGG